MTGPDRRRIVRVVPDVPAIHKRFDYAVPPTLADVEVGSRVRVPLHGRRVAAWVVEDDVTPDPGVHPLDLATSSGLGPPASVVDLAVWAAWRWAGPVSSFLGTASPLRVVRALGPLPAPRTPVPSSGGGSVALVDEALESASGGPVRTEGVDPAPVWMAWWRVVVAVPFRFGAIRRIRNIDYTGDGLYRHKLDVLVRRSGPATGAPVMVYVHGGAWVIGDKREQGVPMLHELVMRGWVCGSAGGHLSALAALTPDAQEWQPGFEDADTSVDVCIPFYGVHDMTGDPEAEGAYGHGLIELLEQRVMKLPYVENTPLYAEASPDQRITASAPPFFVIQGTNDTLVPPQVGRRFDDRLRAISRSPVAYLELPRAQHAFDVLLSIRSRATTLGVVRFLEATRAAARATPRETAPDRADTGTTPQ